MTKRESTALLWTWVLCLWTVVILVATGTINLTAVLA